MLFLLAGHFLCEKEGTVNCKEFGGQSSDWPSQVLFSDNYWEFFGALFLSKFRMYHNHNIDFYNSNLGDESG